MLRGRVPQSSVWALSSVVDHGDTDQARARLRAFVQALPVTEAVDSSDSPEQATSGSGP
jgi:hypothetical protein